MTIASFMGALALSTTVGPGLPQAEPDLRPACASTGPSQTPNACFTADDREAQRGRANLAAAE